MDQALRIQLLRAAVRDRHFLNKAWRDINPDDFAEREEAIIIRASLAYWEKYKEPIGPMLQTDASDLARAAKFGEESRGRLKKLVKDIQAGQIENVSVAALVDRVHTLKRVRFNDEAIEEIIGLHENGELTGESFQAVVARAQIELAHEGVVASNILSNVALQKRIVRRLAGDNAKYPLLLIHALDEKIRAIGRGQLGLFLAPYKGGKGLALIHVAIAYALQGLNVVLITLEDPLDVIEDRFDSAITGIPMNKLNRMPKKLKRKFRRMRELIRGRIKVIDGTEGGWTVPRVEKAWEQLRQEGFTADSVIVDYDDEIVCDKQFKGESGRRMEFAHIYRQMRQAAARLDVIWWTAAQATRKAEGKRIITGADVAEDISKIRKAFLAISIGRDPDEENVRFLYVVAHKLDRSRFGVDIVSDFDSAIFYDPEATLRRRRRAK